MKWILIRLDNGSKFNLSSDTLLYPIGRAKDCLIKSQSLYSSRQHCDIICEQDKIYIIDLKSANGTFINGNRIPPEKATPLEVNDLIGIGVPEIIDAKSIVYKVALESEEVPDVKPALPAVRARKRTASDPIESLPSKITRLDIKPLVNSSAIEKNLDLKEKTNESSDFGLRPIASAEQLITSTSEEDSHCRSKNCSSELKKSPNISPAKDIVSEVIDLAESGSEEEIELVEKKSEIIPSGDRVTEGRLSLNTSSGYTDESNVIVISDDEDDFFSSSLPLSEKENEEGNMDNDDITSPIKKDPLPEKAWESSDDESDNEWWPKLSQSFSEAMEDCVKQEPESDEEKGVGDCVESNEGEGEDKNAGVDVGEENAYGNWFPVLSQDFSGSEDELFIKEEEDSEQECDIVDVKAEEEEVKDEDNMREAIAQGSEVIMKNDCDNDSSDDNFGVDENGIHPGVVSSSAVSDCAQDLEKVRISADETSSEHRSSVKKVGKSPSSPLGVSSYGNRAEEISKSKNCTDVKELRLHLNNKKNSKGPVIVCPPKLVKGRKCVWTDEEQKESANLLITPQSSQPSNSYDNQPESDVHLKNCSVILEDIMHEKTRNKTKGSKNKARATNKLDKVKKGREIQSEALTREDKKKIQEKRKAKLQALSDKGTKDESPQADASSKIKDTSNCSITSNSGNAEKISPDSRPNKVAAKVTTKNRGAFLTEFDLFAASGSDVQKKEKKPKKQRSKSQDEAPQKENKKSPHCDSVKQFADGSIDEHPKLNLPTAVNDHMPLPRASSGMSKVPVGILKPSNGDKDERKKKRIVSFKDQPEVRMFLVSPGVKMMPIKGKDYPLKIPLKYPIEAMPSTLTECNSIVTVIYDICRWNALWLEEQRSRSASEPPPVHLDHCISPIMGTYSSYLEYSKSVYPMLLYEMWARIYKEWDQNFARNPIIQVLLVSVSDAMEGLSPQQELVCLKCQSVISEKNIPVSSCPRVGDLAILEFSEESQDAGPTNDSNKVVSVRVFAYVDAVKRCHITPRVQISQSFGEVPPNSILFNFSLKLKKRKEKMCYSQMGRLKVVCHLLSDLRTFDALLELPKSPLMPHILNPLAQDVKTIVPGHFRVKATECLNPSQKKAVAMTKTVCLSPEPRIGLVQGPPGTGKTKTIVSLIKEMFECEQRTLTQRRRDQKTPKVLLCAPSNAAIDHLVHKLLQLRMTLPKENRFRMVRVGRLEAMHPGIRDISLQELTSKEIKNISNFVNAENVDLQISTIQARVNSLMLALDSVKCRQDIAGQRNIEIKLAEYNQKLEEAKKAKNLNTPSNLSNKDMRNLEMSTEKTVLQFADIVATTLASSANSTMLEAFPRREGAKPHFTCCIIDEACQSLEVESLIPLLHGISNVVLFGDQQQLYPTVMSMVAKQNGLQVSLFERLWSSFTMGGMPDEVAPLVFLNVQYRMHPEICLWPNSHVYQGLIKTPNDLVMERQSPFLPYVIISLEYDQNDPNQLLNGSEAELVCKLFFAMSEKTEKRSYSIGIITPYQKQKDAIEAAIMKRKSTMRIQPTYQCEVNTIDSFQGQERDVVILSCVRSYKIGFLGELKRINVALTRARRSLIVCGNFNSLKNHDLWREFLGDGLTRGIVRCVSGSHIPNQRELLSLVSRGSHE